MTSFEKRGVVSVWLFCEPENPSDRGKDVLRELCGVDAYDLDMQAMFSLDPERLTPVAELLRPLSYAKSFAADAAAVAEDGGITHAYAVIAQFDFAYEPEKVKRPVAPDPRFLGRFAWHD